MEDNLVRLKLSRFTSRDIRKIGKLGDKIRLLHRWFRCEQLDRSDGETFVIYSGDRGPHRYASYRITRHEDGTYDLSEGYGDKSLAGGRTIDEVIDALPDDFYYTKR